MLRNYLLSHITRGARREPRGTEGDSKLGGWDCGDTDTEAQRNKNTLKRGVAKVLKKTIYIAEIFKALDTDTDTVSPLFFVSFTHNSYTANLQ